MKQVTDQQVFDAIDNFADITVEIEFINQVFEDGAPHRTAGVHDYSGSALTSQERRISNRGVADDEVLPLHADHIARQFEKEHEGITVFVDYDAPALRLHLGWTPESKGTAGIVDRIKEFNGLIDAKTLEGKDEYGSDFIVTIK